jgi:hypothetical protein
MKKLLISVGALGVMSFTYNSYKNYQLNLALDNIEEMQEWMLEDIQNGVIPEVYGAYYSEKLYETETLIIDWFDQYNETRPSINLEEMEDLQTKVDNYHN